jgi:hypothetical protein
LVLRELEFGKGEGMVMVVGMVRLLFSFLETVVEGE